MTISAVLLAGGQSRRMGQDKATMLFRGQLLWKNQIGLLRCLEPQEILVSARSDPPWRPVDVSFVPDQKPARGPLGGITATLSRVTTDHLLALAIDTPFMTATYLRTLCAQIESGCGVVPVIEGRAEPVVAIYPRDAEAEFAHALNGKDFSLQPLIRKLLAAGKLRSIEVSVEQRNLFGNLNDPQDLRPTGGTRAA